MCRQQWRVASGEWRAECGMWQAALTPSVCGNQLDQIVCVCVLAYVTVIMALLQCFDLNIKM